MAKAKNLQLFENVYEMVLELNWKDPDYSLRLAGSIVANYNWKRIRYAVKHSWHLYDLDRWELVARAYGRDPVTMIQRFNQHNIAYTHSKFVEIMKDGELFLKLIVDPLYHKGIEVMELVDDSILEDEI